jgi:hypothetical protein
MWDNGRGEMNIRKFVRNFFSKKAGKAKEAKKGGGESSAGKGKKYSAQDEEKIKQRLRDLGYLS